MSDTLYGRRARLTIGRQPVARYDIVPDLNGIVIENLRFQFTATKDLEKNPNSCSIIVSNLSAETRAEFTSKPLTVILEAGYGDNLKQLFKGDVRHIQHAYTGLDWETTIEGGDGERAISSATVNQSYRAGVTKGKALDHIASTLGVKIPTNAAEAEELAARFASGISMEGFSEKHLTDLLKPLDMTWSIQDGELQILREDETTAGQAFLISQAGGMVGIPSIAAPTKPGDPSVMTAMNLLYPELRPGRKCRLESVIPALNGTYRMRKVEHKGDTHGTDWTTSIEGTPIK